LEETVTEDNTAQHAEPKRERLDEDDHDLLTFNEAGERLRIEIAAASARVADLESRGLSDELGGARKRLEALRSAEARISAEKLTDANFERLFGYAGKARRNLSAPPPD
jgi:hypothetical protein